MYVFFPKQDIPFFFEDPSAMMVSSSGALIAGASADVVIVGTKEEHLTHFSFLASNSIVDVIAAYEPSVKIL